jgi:Xaa-Pro aminopeptidase
MTTSPGLDYEARVARLQQRMADEAVDVVLLSAGADLPYFTGYEAVPLERLTMLVVPVEGTCSLFVPELEAARVEPGPFEMVPWAETDDPVRLVARAAGTPRRAAIGDHAWSTFLLRLQSEIPGATWTVASTLTKPLRERKDPAEIDRLRQAAAAADRVVARIPGEVRFEGRTEREVARDVAELTLAEGHDFAWAPIIAAGSDGASPHHEPGDRVIEAGNVVVCDFGGRVGGYFSDTTRTFVVGSASTRQREVHALVLAANEAARALVAPGVTCEEVDRAARRVIADGGHGAEFIHRTGHGIGLEVHEHPYIVEGNDSVLEEGMAFSIEPGIYIPGDFGVRIEDIVVCGPDGVDELNRSDRGLVDVS